MADYISRDELIKALEADFNTDWADYASKNNFGKDYIDGVRDEYDDALTIICKQRNLTDEETEIYNSWIDAEATDVQPVKHGRWTYPYKDKDINQCSECHSYVQDKISNVREMFAYCPFCGARMDKS